MNVPYALSSHARIVSISLVGAGLLGAGCLAGCSAIVAPDPARLGGMDSGPEGPPDSGPAADVGPLDAWSPDAWREDTGTPDLPDGGSDAGPVCPASCDDAIPCTRDSCVEGRCAHEVDDTLCPGERCNVTMGCVPIVCSSAAECDDGDRCNGAERCMPGSGTPTGCVPPEAPLDCNDRVNCTDDSCVPATGCVHVGVNARCDDAVPCTTDVCAGTAGPSGCEYTLNDALCASACRTGSMCTLHGCTDGAPRICADDGSPCTVERCDAAAGGCTADALDADMDGFPAMSATSSGTTVMCRGGTDCDDTRRAVNPSATEICGNGLDDDCSVATPDVCSTPTGEDCGSAQPITLRSGTGTVTGTFSSFRDDFTTSCGTAGGLDAVYYFDVTSTSDIRIETTGAIDTVLASALSCDAAAFSGRCNDDKDPSVNLGSRIWLHRQDVPPLGTVRVYVLVDGYGPGVTGAFTLTVTVSAPTRDLCPTGGTGSTTPMDLSGGGTVLGALSGLGGVLGTQRGTCEDPTSTNAEAIFRLTESDRNIESVTVRSTSFVPHLYTRARPCGSGPELGCSLGTASGGGGSAMVSGSMSGSETLFYVFVDNAPPAGAADYRLDINP